MFNQADQRGMAPLLPVLALAILGVAVTLGYRAYRVQMAPSQRPAENAATEQTPGGQVPASTRTQSSSLPPVKSETFDKNVTELVGKPSPAPNSQQTGSISGHIDTATLQGVLLHNGTGYDFYIGKLSEISAGQWQLAQAFYLKSEGPMLSLVKAGTININIDASKVKAWSNLPQDHRYVKAIREYQSQTVNQ